MDTPINPFAFFDDPPSPESLPDDARWGFTRSGLLGIRHHLHWIPGTRGFSRKYVATRWPGLDWNIATLTLRTARVFTADPSHFSGMKIDERVKEFHILFDGTWRVIHHDGKVRTGGPLTEKQKASIGWAAADLVEESEDDEEYDADEYDDVAESDPVSQTESPVDESTGGAVTVTVEPNLLETREGRRLLARMILEGLRPRKQPPTR
jgi:hypothetical protein